MLLYIIDFACTFHYFHTKNFGFVLQLTAPVLDQIHPNIICASSDAQTEAIMKGIDMDSVVEPVKLSLGFKMW